MQSTDGQITEPFHFGRIGLPGVGPMHANLYGEVYLILLITEQAMQWGLKLSKMEGLIPAIESAHAFAVLDEMKFKPEDIVVINLSGRGDKDLNTYIDYFKL
jgi:tryptophan synthase beta chain